MNVERVKNELRETYPGVNIIENVNSEGEVVEIVGEIDRSLVGSERHVAVAVIDESPEHYHNRTVEEYKVLKGALRLFKNGQPIELLEGQGIVIEPGVRHRAEGEETWLLCYSEPDWSIDDYHLTKS